MKVARLFGPPCTYLVLHSGPILKRCSKLARRHDSNLLVSG